MMVRFGHRRGRAAAEDRTSDPHQDRAGVGPICSFSCTARPQSVLTGPDVVPGERNFVRDWGIFLRGQGGTGASEDFVFVAPVCCTIIATTRPPSLLEATKKKALSCAGLVLCSGTGARKPVTPQGSSISGGQPFGSVRLERSLRGHG